MRIAIDSWTLASRFRCQGTYVYTQNLLREFKKIARARRRSSLLAFRFRAEMATTLSTLLQKTALNFVHQRCSIMIACGASAARAFPLRGPMPM